MINGQSLYWQIYDNQDTQNQSLEQLVSGDQLEKLLEVKTISFEIRSENQVVLDYLTRPATMKKLLQKHVFTLNKTSSTEKAIEIFSCADGMRNAFQTILNSPELLQIVFDVLLQLTPSDEPLKPAELAPPHVYLGFQKLLGSIMLSPKRVQQLAAFLLENLKYFRAWAAHLQSQQVFDVMKQFIIDFKTRNEETNRTVTQIVNKSQLIESLNGFITSNAPLETVSNSSTIIAQIISQNVPGLAESAITKVLSVIQYLMSAELRGAELLRLHPAADLAICAISFMMQRSLALYNSQEAALQKVSYDQIQKRQQFMEQVLANQIQVQQKQNKLNVDYPLINISEIDQYEKIMLPVFIQFLNVLNELNKRLEYLRGQATQGLFGYGSFVIIHFIARLMAISADLKYVVAKTQSDVKSSKVDWMNQIEENSQQIQLQTELGYGQLSLSAHAGCGGPSQIDITSTFKIRNCQMLISIPFVVKKIVSQKLIEKLITYMEQYPSNSNLHFAISRILTPIVELGDQASDVSMYVFQKTDLLKNMQLQLKEFIPFKARTSLQTYYVTFARAFLRIALKLPDESAVEEKQKFVAGRQQQQTKQAPQHLMSATKLMTSSSGGINQQMLEFLQANAQFKQMSQQFLEKEDEIPKTFGDARLTSEFQAKKQQKKKTQGVFDAGFNNFGYQQNDFFGFGGNTWDSPKKQDGDFGFGWGEFQ